MAQASARSLGTLPEEEQLAGGAAQAGIRSPGRRVQARAATGAAPAGTCSQQSCAESDSGTKGAEQHLGGPAAAEPQGLLESETEPEDKVSCSATAVCGCCGCQPEGLLPCSLLRPPAELVCHFDSYIPCSLLHQTDLCHCLALTVHAIYDAAWFQ